MATNMHTLGFEYLVNTQEGHLQITNYEIIKSGERKYIDIPPPSMVRHLVFDAMQEHRHYGGRLKFTSKIAYVYFDPSEDFPIGLEVLCSDTATLQLDDLKRDNRAIMPCRYDLHDGTEHAGEKLLGTDVFHCMIQEDFSTQEGTIKLTPNGESRNLWWQRAGIVSYDAEMQMRPDGLSYIVKGSFTIERHILGEFSGVVPIPEFPAPNTLADHSIVLGYWGEVDEDGARPLILSNKAFGNLKQLSDVLANSAPQTVWVFGSPGSGKEVFAQALHSGSVISRGKIREDRSAAGVGLKELSKKLFSSDLGKHCLVEKVDGGGTIFLDEFDKVNEKELKDIYGSLLRVLEADEYIKESMDVSGNSSEILKKLDTINWIFAGAFSTIKADQIPPDFWSRLTGQIQLENPLTDNKPYAATLFLYFYVREAVSLLGPTGSVSVVGFIRILETKPKERKFNEQVIAKCLGEHDRSLSEDDIFTPSKDLFNLAKEFSELVKIVDRLKADDNSLAKTPDATRGIRQAARAAFQSFRRSAVEDTADVFKFDDHKANAMQAAERVLKLSRGELQ
ncbi:sigma 54-interacting transcriptional regulator [uncultured Roseobacter sp.]|uniref:sigma 54-interacting transcriptional regulator n=1 Tax=uncultured Roseobacter sp. TaxID=114847 RepID=UPI0026111301|nr:sigma 54-interacting transcriptional regulator [uncultured Roseobacter sp.]